MHDADILAYVRAASSLLELPLDDVHSQAVAGHLSRTRVMAKQLEAFTLPPLEEMSEVFCPATFPTADPEQDAA
jgi:hypothetical protein